MQGCFVSFSLPRAVVLLLVTATPLLAQAAPTPGEQDLIRDRQDRLLEEQRRRLEELKDLPGKAAGFCYTQQRSMGGRFTLSDRPFFLVTHWMVGCCYPPP